MMTGIWLTLLLLSLTNLISAFLFNAGWIQSRGLSQKLAAGKFTSPNQNNDNNRFNSRTSGRAGKPAGGPQPNQLTKSEIKAKNLQKENRPPFVTRSYEGERLSLDKLKVGDNYSGQIITIKDFGLYVDIGAIKDGLVHVKDLSRDYFVQNIANRYTPGDKVNTWIKFIDIQQNKFGLQMFPLSPNRVNNGIPKLDIEKISIGDLVEGIVVRVSDYGVYVDIDAESDAYLHKRKMKLNKKQYKLKPWEILPIGYKLKCYIHEIDIPRRRISITTYHPDVWEEMLPIIGSNQSEDDDMVEDDEELGGSSRADNIRALERTLALNIDDDDDLDDDDDDGEEMSVNEIASAITDPSRRAKLLLDDSSSIESDSMTRSSSISASSSMKSSNEAAEEISIDELFEDLANGRPYITVNDVLKWDYLAEVIAEGDIDKDTVKDLFLEAGAEAGKIYPDQLDTFIDLLTDELGLEEDDGTYDDNDDDDDDDDDEKSFLIDPNDLPDTQDDSLSYLMKDDEEKSDFDRIDMNDTPEDEKLLLDLQVGVGVNQSKSTAGLTLADHYEKKSKNNDLLNYVFGMASKGKNYVTYDDVKQWEFAKALLNQGTIDEMKLLALFNKCNPKKGNLDVKSFEKLIDVLGDLDNDKSKTKSLIPPKTTQNVISIVGTSINNPKITSSAANVISNIQDEESENVDFDDDIELADELFALFKNKKSISYIDLLKSELIENMIEDEVLTADSLKSIMMDAGASIPKKGSKNDVILKKENFDDFADRLQDYLTDFFEDLDPDDDEDNIYGDDGFDSGFNSPMHSEITFENDGESHPTTEVLSSHESDTDDRNDDKVNLTRLSEETDEHEEDDDELIEDVFNGLAAGKPKVSLKDMLNWDLCEDLIGQDLLSEDSLATMMEECGADRKGVDLDGFDRLVDKLVSLYDNAPDSTEADAIEKIDFSDIDDEDDGEEYYDIDIDDVFDEISKGSDTISIDDIKNWDLIQQMTKAGLMNDAELLDVLESAGLSQKTIFNRDDFAEFVEEIEERTIDNEDED